MKWELIAVSILIVVVILILMFGIYINWRYSRDFAVILGCIYGIGFLITILMVINMNDFPYWRFNFTTTSFG